ncbi:MAG: MFS transporter [Candidatus Saccharimonadales bacterium]
MFALRMVAVFTSIYLLQEGFSLSFLTLFWGAFFGYKAVVAWPAALVIARIGPKHGTLLSNILAAVSMAFLPFVPSEHSIWALAGWCVFQASSTCLYDLCYLVDFSKVKNTEHAGKEIAYMNILEKVASGTSPVIGGFLAFLVGPQVVMVLAAVLFLFAAIPLFKTGEPTKTHQKISFQGFPWRTTWQSLMAETAVGIDTFATGTAWTLFMAIVIFNGDQGEIYAKVGLLSSVSLIAALFASHVFGRLIDRHRGRDLLRISTIANSMTHVLRAFITTPISVVFANILNEAATTGYSMAFTRGIFDTADASGKRLAYLFLIELAVNIGSMLAALLLAAIVIVLSDDGMGIRLFFVIVAAITLVIMKSGFRLYQK